MINIHNSKTRLAHPPAARAFTLIELLVVISIIALLISILVPSLQAARELARKARCQANCKSIGTAIQFYVQNSNDWLPPVVLDYSKNGSFVWERNWADFMMPLVDGSCRVDTTSWYSVAWISSPGGSVVTSKMLDCPTILRGGWAAPEYLWNGSMWWSDNWYEDPSMTSPEVRSGWQRRLLGLNPRYDMAPGAYSKLSAIPRPGDVVAVMEQGVYPAGGSVASWAFYPNRWRGGIENMGYEPPHSLSSNAVMVSGSVLNYKQKFIQDYGPTAPDGTAPTTSIYYTVGLPFGPVPRF